MNRNYLTFHTLIPLFFITPAFAQQPVIPIWNGVAPGSEMWKQQEVEYMNGKQKMIRNVVIPTLTAYLPEKSKAVGTAVIVCPGGGFRFHSWDSEGVDVAKWRKLTSAPVASGDSVRLL